MPHYLIDENLPADMPFWNNDRFIHVSSLENIASDTEIWQFALKNNLTIVTKDADFYHRYLASLTVPKVVWFKTGNMKKKDFNTFVEKNWAQAEALLSFSSFIIVDNEKIEGL